MRRFVHITAGFWLMILWFAAVNGWYLVGVILLSSFVHEAGHYLVLRGCGANIRGLEINLFGAILETDTSCLTYGEELLAVAAGPIANLLCAAAFAWSRLDYSVWIGCNLALCLFNLLPICPLDGGRMVALLAAWLLGPQATERWVQRLELAGGLAVSVVFLWVVWETKGSFWLFLPAMGLLSAILRKRRENKHFL